MNKISTIGFIALMLLALSDPSSAQLLSLGFSGAAQGTIGSSSSLQDVIGRTGIGKSRSLSGVNVVTIAEARKDANGDLIPDHSVARDTVMVFGVITTPNYQTTQTAYFIQDQTAGIEVFAYSAPTSAYALGDSVSVIGVIAQYRGLTEIMPLALDTVNFRVIKHNVKVPQPQRLTLSQFTSNPEQYEGQLVEIDTLYKSSGTWPALGSYSSVYVTQAKKTDSLQMFLDSDTNIDGTPEPRYPINVIGIISQYSSGSTVYNNGYELMPRFLTDITSITMTDVTDAYARPAQQYELLNNYPNPFNPGTTIGFRLPKTSKVLLQVFNTLGQLVTTLVDGRKEAGSHQVQWNANVPSGTYFCRLQADGNVEMKKMILLK